jgi:hypothetical protein
MVEIIAGIVALVIITILLVGFISQRNAYARMSDHFVKASFEAFIVKKELENVVKDHETLKFSHNQDFVKFLSDSRDMAFEYIEDVQRRITLLQSSMEKNDPILINQAIDSIIEMLPKEEEKPNS